MNEWELTDEEIDECEVSRTERSLDEDLLETERNIEKAAQKKLAQYIDSKMGMEEFGDGDSHYYMMSLSYDVWQAVLKSLED